MHKEQNVIKIYLILFLLSIIKISAQEKIEGDYLIVDGTGYFFENYSFDKNKIFFWKKGGDLGISEHGKGHYQIKNDSLILNYDLTELKYESYYKLKKFYNAKDSIQVNLRVKDFENNPLNEITVFTDPAGQSTNVNDKGLANLIFKKGSFKDKIKLNVDGAFWAECVIVLDSDTNYNIDVFMNKSEIIGLSHPKAIKGFKINYKIIENSKHKLKLKNSDQVLTLKKQS